MKVSVQPKYTKKGHIMASVEITLLIDEEDDKKVRDFLKTTKEKGVLEISGLPPVAGKNLAVDY